MTTDSKLIVCPNCRAINRVHNGREAEATCGKCTTKVFEPVALELVGTTFDRHITKNEVPVLVDFYSPTCGPCLMMGPQFAEAAKTLHPKVRLAKIDTTADQAIAARFNVRAVPTLILFKGGREIARQPGAMNASDIVSWVGQHI
ncbi:MULTISPECIES: thioredoxin domain-containing protein [unclassified Pseudodesulfovibrio]|uniref:thioredoxin family protein n=1 Tax=unclassified Pseudodesulfovibrio TaxID=2661612 RepID=UPI000FEBF0B8|nr:MULTISPECIES: thioredoxin domain-containing protein [unclassified Pseudodesulfovibrio]MCJ2166023.1 thioredoxin domain-containing protein [Pseudodesulfovibrio sp. S3-i]RWU02539.1 thiol reductase thioredoxin [Pseudodesulfovibrio sp. S3]